MWGQSAFAQGLIWSLPEEDGVGVRYEGTYRQLIKRPNVVEGDTTITWTKRLRIASVGREEAEFRGTVQPCRWIEFKVQTGRPKEGDIDAGPGSASIYKVLIPESIVRGSLTEPVAEDREIYVSYIPIVKGYRKLGDEEAQPIDPPVLQIRPVISQLQHYRNLQPEEGPTEIQIPLGNIQAQLYKGSSVDESPNRRVTNSAEIYRSEEIPFGVAKWTARTVVEEKPTTAPRSEFAVTSEIVEELSAHEVLNGVESELVTN
jgi:hypothetical protein